MSNTYVLGAKNVSMQLQLASDTLQSGCATPYPASAPAHLCCRPPCAGKLHFVKFETAKIGQAIDFIEAKGLHTASAVARASRTSEPWPPAAALTNSDDIFQVGGRYCAATHCGTAQDDKMLTWT